MAERDTEEKTGGNLNRLRWFLSGQAEEPVSSLHRPGGIDPSMCLRMGQVPRQPSRPQWAQCPQAKLRGALERPPCAPSVSLAVSVPLPVSVSVCLALSSKAKRLQ